ncbi:hypothetical protein AOT81_01570 [Xylella fastidiosa]|nr:hypothetical protein AOT81_01570 [Xylella fastidiosa]
MPQTQGTVVDEAVEVLVHEVSFGSGGIPNRLVWGDAVLIGDFCHILSGATGEEGEDGREEFAGWGCQKNLKDGQNRGDGPII